MEENIIRAQVPEEEEVDFDAIITNRLADRNWETINNQNFT